MNPEETELQPKDIEAYIATCKVPECPLQSLKDHNQEHGSSILHLLSTWRRNRLLLTILMTVGIAIAYADRSNLSTAILPMSEEYGWNVSTEGAILGSFFYGYVLTQILGGVLADRHGGRWVLAIGLFIWSLCTLLTPEAAKVSLSCLLTIRFIMGLGEGVTFAALHSMIVDCIPQRWQSTAGSLLPSAASFGNLIGFALTPLIIEGPGWEWAFYYFGVAGFGYIPLWLMLDTKPNRRISQEKADSLDYSDTLSIGQERQQDRAFTATALRPYDPMSSAVGSKAPCEIQKPPLCTRHSVGHCSLPIAADPLGAFAARTQTCCCQDRTNDVIENESQVTQSTQPNVLQEFSELVKVNPRQKLTALQSMHLFWTLLHYKEVWAVIICQFSLGWPLFSVLSWLPRIIQDMHQVEMSDISLFISLPALIQGVVGVICGPIGDALIHTWGFSRHIVRHSFQSLAMIPPAVLLLLAYYSSTAMQMSICITAALGFMACRGVAVLVSQQDIAPHCAGLLFGIGNTANIVSAMIATPLTGALRHYLGSWEVAFWLFSINLVVGHIFWVCFAGTQPLDISGCNGEPVRCIVPETVEEE